MSVLANRDFLHLLEQLLAYLARMYDDHDGGEKLETRASFPGSGFRKCSKETPVFWTPDTARVKSSDGSDISFNQSMLLEWWNPEI